MKTAYETALDEFREASADVRRTYGLVTAARERQIIADSEHADAQVAHAAAQVRFAKADEVLQSVRPEAPTPADITPAVQAGSIGNGKIEAVSPLT